MQVMLNAHEWVEHHAHKQTVLCSVIKEGNCFVGRSFRALDQIADTLCEKHTIGRLTNVLSVRDVGFIRAVCALASISKNNAARGFAISIRATSLNTAAILLFNRGATLDEVYQSMIERTRRLLDVDSSKPSSDRRIRARRVHHGTPRAVRVERVVDETAYDVTFQGPLRPSNLEDLR